MNLSEHRFGILLATLVTLASCHGASVDSRAENRRPNLLILVSDDQRWDALAAAGTPVIRTPNLDRLAARGVMFRNAFVTTSICSVSRASLLIGQYARRHGIHNFQEPFSAEALRHTYPAILRDAGYTTGFIGKWGVGASLKNLANLAERFDFWAGASQQTNYWHEESCRYVRHNGIDDKKDNVCDCPPDADGVAGPRPRKGRVNIESPIHLTIDIIPEKVNLFLDSRPEDRPFSLSVFFKAPHQPFRDWHPSFGALYTDEAMPVPRTATPEEAALMPTFLKDALGRSRGLELARGAGKDGELQDVMRHYFRAVTGLDTAVGKIRDALEARGLADSTVIIFTSDNGHLMGAHGLFGKWLMYEESIRVPMIVYDPRLPAEQRGRTSDEMVLNIDVAPTILDLAGLPVSRRMQGKSMVALLTRPDAAFRESWFYELQYSPPSPRRLERSEGVRTRHLKYIRYIDQTPPHEELYDLVVDPHETRNLAGLPGHEGRLEELRREYERLRRSVEESSAPSAE